MFSLGKSMNCQSKKNKYYPSISIHRGGKVIERGFSNTLTLSLKGGRGNGCGLREHLGIWKADSLPPLLHRKHSFPESLTWSQHEFWPSELGNNAYVLHNDNKATVMFCRTYRKRTQIIYLVPKLCLFPALWYLSALLHDWWQFSQETQDILLKKS